MKEAEVKKKAVRQRLLSLEKVPGSTMGAGRGSPYFKVSMVANRSNDSRLVESARSRVLFEMHK